jgi:hypothetical protein
MRATDPMGHDKYDKFILLCERCGYGVDGLPPDGVCPECALEIERSLPVHRPGTPWQQRPSFATMLGTFWLAARHPVRTLDTMAVTPPRFWRVLMIASVPFGLLLGIVLLLVFEIERPLPNGGSVAWYPGSVADSLALGIVLSLAMIPLAAAALAGLTWVEARGLVLFSAQRGGRVYPELAHAIVRHGAAGWLVSAIGALLLLPLAWSFETDVGPIMGRSPSGAPPTWMLVLGGVGLALAVLGFLGFELFAWLGLRRCKFANRPKPTQDVPIASV